MSAEVPASIRAAKRPRADASPYRRPMEREVVARFAQESGRSNQDAQLAHDLLVSNLEQLRQVPDGQPLVVEIETHRDFQVVHKVLKAAMPAKRRLAPDGSAQAMFQRRYLRDDELGIVHTSDPKGYCAIELVMVRQS